MPNSTPATRPSGQVRYTVLLLSALLLSTLGACGLKGDLTLEPQTPGSSQTDDPADDGQDTADNA